ncbi:MULTISPECIES: Asp-tRNA(Asn)/Glu-tRNA(Gln) amidotransferase subunit GatB [Bifidobacterium]|uniref:Aspartyl/glutamyl-tRNA(Asn/Gln) amidotransferase subunit B n=2 Tax=Bifidobacterium TaxID=1678 RepID=A0A261FRW3_9BIFI|nr:MULTISPECIES: Asp-tRNA(Asn)/Glu-tRNA(Gln) amidotransferase subunit GatB [Bifidobacterium]OZG61897.1 glutamyl-tRNA amidotransferase [Bifidobacterium lemurum]OZG69540.1 glutamyl-tRNA amidotransferase [Bifidobacterium eulemuris]QOL32086.1 Asp-tRNA(Asn)/Glu-tRNA(Gln) amidotransferase subunit GatB [Bifidobacterium eulemuris]QOL33309.1 Asp-tRNA(Asn)/Glu-tRNA(Gln) amidotransferase subunit GatB [Bifidobacterium lemurum]
MADKLMKYSEAVKQFDPVLGLETHVELSTTTKLFCPAEVAFGGEPNSQLTPVSLGLPGSLPVLNATAVDYAIKLGLALHCEIAEWSQFSRKNYFYPDMPRDYQISQYDKPTNGNGYLDVELEDGTVFRVPIERAHIEDDAGKNTHVGGSDGRIEGADHSLVDYNRAGVPLIEIVTKPIEGAGERAPEIAAAYMRAIRDIVRALNISHARMEQGNMRADVNVSLRRSASDPFGTRSETKNVNSFRAIEKTVQYEIRRQAQILSEGGEILQETRHWDESSQSTAGGRVKSDADDYRYFPDPDLVMLHITKEHIARIEAEMPEMPRERRNRLKAEWGLSDLQMRDVLNADALDLIEATVAAGATAAGARKWWLGELSREANAKGVSLEELPITAADVAEVEKLIAEGKLNDKLAKQTVVGVLAGEGTPAEVVEKHGYKIVSDDGLIDKAVDEALAANPDVAEKLKSGNMKPMGVIIGAVMKATRGQADAKAVTKVVMGKIK